MKIINVNNSQIDSEVLYNINSFCYFVSDYTLYNKDMSIDEAIINVLNSLEIDVIIFSSNLNFFEEDDERDLNFRYTLQDDNLSMSIYYQYNQFHIDVCTFSLTKKKLRNVVNQQKLEVI